jgi:glycosyltransferase involved in cell wall biosynthesis
MLPLQGSAQVDLPELVSVVIPAFNAGRYLDLTLQSVRAQSHSALEIIVVDDGSTDDTVAIARRHTKADPRIQIVNQSNGGVASARNRGIALATGRYVAPIDADDLWAPKKIERQLQAALSTDREAGLVYSWYAVINEEGYVYRRRRDMPDGKRLLRELCSRNAIGNGSSPLLLRRAVLECGGYDPTLRARGGEGCEDYKLYFKVAERYPAVLVPDYLMGYRSHQSAMSRDRSAMMRSHEMVLEELAGRRPDLQRALLKGKMRYKCLALGRALRYRQFSKAAQILNQVLREGPVAAIPGFGTLLARAAIFAIRNVRSGDEQSDRSGELFWKGQVPTLSKEADVHLPGSSAHQASSDQLDEPVRSLG